MLVAPRVSGGRCDGPSRLHASPVPASLAALDLEGRHDRLVQTLRDVVQALDELDDEATIYTDGSSPAARAVVVRASDRLAGADGLRYFVEVALAKDAVQVWSDWRGSAQ